MSKTNETRHIEWYETCKCKCRLDPSVYNNKQRWNEDMFRCECKELIVKEICDKRFIWNPSNCECDCDKPCDAREYLDYENCECKKSLVDQLVEECSKNIDENEMISVTLNDYGSVCNSCTTHIVLFVIAFLIIIGISSAFIYFHGYLKKSNTGVVNKYPGTNLLNIKMGNIKKINIKNQTHYFFNDMINIKNFMRKHSYKNNDIYYIRYITIKKLVIMKVLIL